MIVINNQVVSTLCKLRKDRTGLDYTSFITNAKIIDDLEKDMIDYEYNQILKRSDALTKE